jgi:hypothetical protein
MGLVDNCRFGVVRSMRDEFRGVSIQFFTSEGMETAVVATRSDATDKKSGKCMIVQVLLVLFNVHQ